jgi:hypothetical protein
LQEIALLGKLAKFSSCAYDEKARFKLTSTAKSLEMWNGILLNPYNLPMLVILRGWLS